MTKTLSNLVHRLGSADYLFVGWEIAQFDVVVCFSQLLSVSILGSFRTVVANRVLKVALPSTYLFTKLDFRHF